MEKNLQLGYDIGITNIPQQKEVFLKISKSETRSSIKTLPEIRYEDQQLSSFSGLVIFQKLFQAIDLKERLRRCFSHLKSSSTFGLHNIAFLLVVHIRRHAPEPWSPCNLILTSNSICAAGARR